MNFSRVSLAVLVLSVVACAPIKTKEETTQLKMPGKTSDGKEVSYFENGKVKSEIMYRGGAKNGETVVYYENGKVKYRINYVNDVKEGPAEWFFTDGKLYQKRNHKNGEQDGLREDYTPSGKKITHSFYKEGYVLPGGTEYKLDGTVRKNPEIVVEKEDQLKTRNVFSYKFSMSEDIAAVKYFVCLEKSPNAYWKEQNITRPGKIGIIELALKPGQMMQREVTVYALYRRTNGYEGVIGKTVALNASNRN